MSNDIFLPNKNQKCSFNSLFDLEDISTADPLSNMVDSKHSSKLYDAVKSNIQDGGDLDSLNESAIKDMLSSDIPTNTEDIDKQLQTIFGNIEDNKKWASLNDNATKSKKNSRKYNMRVEKHMKRSHKKKSKTNNSENSHSVVYDATSSFNIDSANTDELLYDSSLARVEPPGLVAHRKLVDHVRTNTNLPGGPLMQVFANIYKKLISKSNPDMDSVTKANEAIKLFDKDSDSSRKEKYEQAKVELAETKKEKKALKQAKKEKKEKKANKFSKESVTSVTSVTSVSE